MYSNAVFLASISKVLGRVLLADEKEMVTLSIKEALKEHNTEKQNIGIVNNCISNYKNSAQKSISKLDEI